MEIIKHNQELALKLHQNSLTKRILNFLVKGTSGEVHIEMCRYKDKGEPLYLKVLEIVPVSERLPALSKIYGVEKMTGVLTVLITKTLNNFNLRVGMNPEQITQLSYSLLESAEEDQLAIQDIVLFLDGMLKYKWGKVYDRMDMPTFYEMLEVYREQRHKAFMSKKEEDSTQFKAYGDTNRMSVEQDKTSMREAMKDYLTNK